MSYEISAHKSAVKMDKRQMAAECFRKPKPAHVCLLGVGKLWLCWNYASPSYKQCSHGVVLPYILEQVFWLQL